ncbi:MAG TPA: hypothetical protein VJ914_01505 [Pseudonocardiaceae bacterium]|nr:hypothetical protein [Pseudonocardiaceae bacterium]
MDFRTLSARIDPLAAPERLRVLADIARELAGTPELTALLAELNAAPGVTRTWAMTMATVAGEQSYLRQCLTSPDAAQAGSAVRYCVRHQLHFGVVRETLPTAPMAWRQSLYRALRASRTTEWAQRLFPLVRERFGDHEAAAVLPACDAETVAAQLPELDFAVTNLTSLARRHPGVVLAHLRGLLDAASEAERGEVWRRCGPAIRNLVEHDPAALLDLLEAQGPVTGLPPGAQRWLIMLAKLDAERLTAILADRDRRIWFRVSKRLGRELGSAPDDSLVALARSTMIDGDRLIALLRRLPPSRRPRILDGALNGRDLVQAHAPIPVLDILPWQARHAHAQRLTINRTVADVPEILLKVTARLPWAQAEPLLRKETTRPDATDRATGYRLLIAAAAATRDQETVSELLASLTRLPNEQDPVRSAALAAVAGIPAWLFQPAAIAQLEKLAIDALQARDASWSTRNTVHTLATRLISHGAATLDAALLDGGLEILRVTGSYRAHLSFHGLTDNLPRGAEHQLFEVLRARIAADAAVGRHDLALSLAEGLRRRAWDMPALQEYVRAALEGADDGTIRRAVVLWLAPPATRGERVEAIFTGDPSTITLPSVSNAISRERTDLLDRVFAGSLHGRFLKPDVRFVPIFGDGLRTWLPRQHARYAELLADVATTPGKIAWERTAAVRRLGRVPGVGADAVRPFLGDEEVTVVEAALAALAWTDRPDQVLGELLGYADTDRARVAVYAATRCARSVGPAALVDALRPVLAGRKVTSRKEAIRLLAQLRAPGAAAELIGLWADPELHRDLRRSIVSAARWLLDDARMWTILAEAAGARRAVATAVTDAGPFTVARPNRSRYAALIRTVAGSADPDTARAGLHAWPAWSAWDRDGAHELVAVACDLGATPLWRPAMDALVEACAITGDAEPVSAALRTLASADEPDAADRDLPARQRLHYLISGVTNRVESAGETARRAAGALTDILSDFPDHRPDAINLAIAALPRRGDLLPGLRRIVTLADRPVLAWRAADQVGDWLDASRPSLLATATALTTSAAGAQVALGIAAQAGEEAGWSAPWRELVRALRTHADPDVRDRARSIATAPE